MAKKSKKHRSPTKTGGLRLKCYERTNTANGMAYCVTMDQYGRIMRQDENGETVPTGNVGSATH